MATSNPSKDRNLLADTITGLLLAGIGQVTQDQKNFFIVEPKTEIQSIEATFSEYTQREDIAILLINQHNSTRSGQISKAFPALLEIPSKDHPYDPSKDSVLKRVQKLFGE
ncbi:F subunit of V-type ATPase [Russula aff. rugulosa BPL654]|nr:F subunit of V-type ATPase [Russula aff. rugulosa BPL654]